MKLFYAPQSPFARKVRAAAIEVGLGDRIELEIIKVVPGAPNRNFAQSYNPLRKIPTLVTDDGSVIYDSTVICEFLDAEGGGGKIIPPEPKRRWRVLTDHALAQGLCESAILIRYETWLRPEAYRWPVWIEDHWDKINSGLSWFEQNMVELDRPVDISHLALGSFLGYLDFRWPDDGWRDRFPKVRDWFEEISQRPAFAETIPIDPPAA